MESSVVSIYKHIRQNVSSETIPIDMFINDIQSGRWQDQVLQIRIIKDYEERKKAKGLIPYVTLSGYFAAERNAKGLTNHSGFIGMDIDNISQELQGIKALLSTDPYVYACFTSVSGTGLCVIFKIDPEKHLEAFNGIADYLIKKYQIVIDPSGKDICRPRFISFDPEVYFNTEAAIFKKYLAKEKKRKISSTIFVKTEFDQVISEMIRAGVSCVEDYRDWLSIGFGLADQFGEGGREYFHQLSGISSKYERSMCDRQFTHCLRQSHTGHGKVTIATIYYFAKQAGINIYTEKTKRIASVTTTQKKAGLSASQIADNLEKFEGISKQDADDIISQAFQSSSDFSQSTSLVENIRLYLRHTYDIKLNEITRKLENKGKDLDDREVNTMFLDAKVIFEDLNFDIFYRILISNNTVSYNPILQWFADHLSTPKGVIDDFFSCFKTEDDLSYFGKKWLVSVISAAHGVHSPLMLIYVSEEQGTGKTEAFRRMIPVGLRRYYGESKLDSGKDDEILMTQKLIIMDDEMAGKSKKESEMIKGLTSKQTFSLREPYGRANVDLNRLAVLCGTTNSKAILNDPTGNRRFIPIEIESVDFDRFNAINKDDLFSEAYNLYHEGFKWELSKEDIERLNSKSDKFQDLSSEYELIIKYFKVGESMELSATEIKMHMEMQSGQKNLSLRKIGVELKRLGYKCKVKKVNGKACQLYSVDKNDFTPTPEDEMPF